MTQRLVSQILDRSNIRRATRSIFERGVISSVASIGKVVDSMVTNHTLAMWFVINLVYSEGYADREILL